MRTTAILGLYLATLDFHLPIGKPELRTGKLKEGLCAVMQSLLLRHGRVGPVRRAYRR